MSASNSIPTVEMKGPGGLIRVNESDVEEYKKRGFKTRRPVKTKIKDEFPPDDEEEEEETPSEPEEEEEEEEEGEITDLIGSMSGPQLVEFVDEQELDVTFVGNDKVADKRQKVLDALAERDGE